MLTPGEQTFLLGKITFAFKLENNIAIEILIVQLMLANIG